MTGEVEVDDTFRLGVSDADHVGWVVRGRDVIERAVRRAQAVGQGAVLVVNHGEQRMVRFGLQGDAV